MTQLAHDILRAAEAEICRPWLRHILTAEAWSALTQAAKTQGWSLIAHWADTVQAHALFLDPDILTVVPVSTQIVAGRYPALSPTYPGAAWYERMIRDLWGHQAEGGMDTRPWLDHGQWPQTQPMATRPDPYAHAGPVALADVDALDTMQLPLGPLWGHLNEAAQLRLSLDGRLIRQAEAHLGFTHKGTLTLMRGKSPRAAARFAARLSADATVAHSVAFAHAAEAALDVQAPPRAIALRIVMLELERIAGHLDNLTEVARIAGSQPVSNRCGALREVLLRAAEAAFGHRLMMDCVIPGGIAVDIAVGGAQVLLRALGDIVSELAAIRVAHESGVLAARLSGVGVTNPAAILALHAGGIIGRAATRSFDVRSVFMPGFEGLNPRIPTLRRGDAAARQSVRLFEIEESMRLTGIALDALPEGPLTVALPPVSGEGIACAESIRGDVWHWIRLDHGQIAAVFPRDPGWALWPLAERVLTNTLADDADLIRTSLALPASGMDL